MNKTCKDCPFCRGIYGNMVSCGDIPDVVTWAIADKRVRNKKCFGSKRFYREELKNE